MIALLAALSACDDSGASHCEGLESPPTLQVGGHDELSGFVELVDGDDLLVQLGPRGYQSIFVALRGRGLYPGDAETGEAPPELEVRAVAEERELGGYSTVARFVEADDHLESDRIWIELIDENCQPVEYDIECYAGLDLTVETEVVDACGNEAAAALTVSLCNSGSAHPCTN